MWQPTSQPRQARSNSSGLSARPAFSHSSTRESERALASVRAVKARLALAIGRRPFRWLIVAISGTAIGIQYVWQTLITPAFFPGSAPVDFIEDYVGSANLMLAGIDPYSACHTRACWADLANTASVYPPVVTWLSLPLAHIDRTVSGDAALIAMQIFVVIFLFAVAFALQVRDRQAIVALAIVTIAFPPLIGEIVKRNLEVLLLALSGIWFWGYVLGDRWLIRTTIGIGLALKLVQAPLLFLGIWCRRWVTTVAALAAFAVLWAVGAPQYLPEFITRVLPGFNTGTGYAMDVAPVATFARLFHPGSMYGYGSGVDMTVRLLGYLIAGAVVVLTVITVGSPRSDRDGRALEAAAVVSATPLVLAVVRPGHLLLLLLPITMLTIAGVRKHDWQSVGLVVASWALMGPIYLAASNLLAAGIGLPWTRGGEETAVAGAIVLWVVSLRVLRAHRAPALGSVPAPLPATTGSSLRASRLM